MRNLKQMLVGCAWGLGLLEMKHKRKDWGRNCPLERAWTMRVPVEKSFRLQNLFSSLFSETDSLVQQGCKFPFLCWVTVSSKEAMIRSCDALRV